MFNTNKPAVLNAVVTLADGKSYEVQFEDQGKPPLNDDEIYIFRTAAHGNELVVRGSSIVYLQIVGESGEVDNPIE